MELKYTEEKLREICSKSKSMIEVFRFLSIFPSGSYYRWFKEKIRFYEIDISHFTSESMKPRSFNILNLGFTETRIVTKTLRRALLQNDVENKCNSCGISQWLGINITLDIDHIDGNNLNNNLGNLQFLCPNCHRLKTLPDTPSEARNYARQRATFKKKCPNCDALISDSSMSCAKCRIDRVSLSSVVFPDNLQELVWEKQIRILAQEIGIGVTTLKRYLNNHAVKTPPNGYWQNFRVGNLKTCREIKNKTLNG